jgi:DNA-damage-inducible protein D
MTKRKQSASVVQALLNDPNVRRAYHEGRAFYCVTDLIRILAETRFPEEHWADLKKREPVLASLEEHLELECEGNVDIIPALDIQGVFRLVQAIASPAAERIKRWLSESAVLRLEELENPELAVLRMRKAYEDKGYSPRWIDKRLRGVSARQELTSEWARRGVDDGDQYRALTNAIMDGAFGMDVESLRRYKNLQRPTQNLRDYMSDLELVLTSLGETAAVALHRNRASHGIDELLADAQEAGRIAGAARTQIEQGSARRPKANHAA